MCGSCAYGCYIYDSNQTGCAGGQNWITNCSFFYLQLLFAWFPHFWSIL
jgi:interleukin-1 receptor-associated kinase 1